MKIAISRAAALALAGSALAATAALATPASPGFVGTALLPAPGLFGPLDINTGSDRGHPDQDRTNKWDLKLMTKDDTHLHVTRNAIAPSAHSGWHTHPGPSLVTVTQGEITVYDGHDPLCGKTVFRAGQQGTVDIGGGAVHLIRNETSSPAETVSVQFVPAGAARRIDRPKPTNCPDIPL